MAYSRVNFTFTFILWISGFKASGQYPSGRSCSRPTHQGFLRFSLVLNHTLISYTKRAAVPPLTQCKEDNAHFRPSKCSIFLCIISRFSCHYHIIMWLSISSNWMLAWSCKRSRLIGSYLQLPVFLRVWTEASVQHAASSQRQIPEHWHMQRMNIHIYLVSKCNQILLLWAIAQLLSVLHNLATFIPIFKRFAVRNTLGVSNSPLLREASAEAEETFEYHLCSLWRTTRGLKKRLRIRHYNTK